MFIDIHTHMHIHVCVRMHTCVCVCTFMCVNKLQAQSGGACMCKGVGTKTILCKF